MTDRARQVWQVGRDADVPLRVDDLRPQTNREAATAWLLQAFVQRLPEDLRDAVRAAALLREVSLEALNAMLAPRHLDPVTFARLLSLSFVGRPPAPARTHDLVREVEDSWRRRQEPAEFHWLHTAAFQYFREHGDMINSLYHLLAIDEDQARNAWVEATDQARLHVDLDVQSELLGLLQMPERQQWLQLHTQAFHGLYSGLLAVYQNRLDNAFQAFSQAIAAFRTAGDPWGAATATLALGDLYVRTARLDDALTAYNQALPIYQDIHARLGEANTLQAFARFHSLRGDSDHAERAFTEALDIYNAIGEHYSIAARLTYRGQHRLADGDARAGDDWAWGVTQVSQKGAKI
jgi:tetratricopeptide (TPR) repeat protein